MLKEIQKAWRNHTQDQFKILQEILAPWWINEWNDVSLTYLLLFTWLDLAARIGIFKNRCPWREWQICGTQNHPSWCHPVRSAKMRIFEFILHIIYIIKAMNHSRPQNICQLVLTSFCIRQAAALLLFHQGFIFMSCRLPPHLPAQWEQHAPHSACSLCVHWGQGLHPCCLCGCLAFYFVFLQKKKTSAASESLLPEWQLEKRRLM